MKKITSTFGENQVGYFDDGSINTECNNKVAIGVIDTSTSPSTIYSYGYPDSTKVLGKLLGKHGVNTDSLVIDNTSRKTLGIVDSLR